MLSVLSAWVRVRVRVRVRVSTSLIHSFTLSGPSWENKPSAFRPFTFIRGVGNILYKKINYFPQKIYTMRVGGVGRIHITLPQLG